MKRYLLCLSLLFATVTAAQAQTAPSPNQQSSDTSQSAASSTQQPSQTIPPVQETVEVTATRLPEDPEKVPYAIEVISGEELQMRGIRDLRSALGTATGVSVAPGGDQGPASAVPQFWGLQEMDAYLLVVDGIPWGGAFNPAMTALNLSDIDRIEVLRGPAPVMYGATSFVGVIQVVHKDAVAQQKSVSIWGGSFATGGGSFSSPIPLPGNWSSRVTLEGERQGYSNQRTSYVRGHGLWSVEHHGAGANHEWIVGDLNWLNQDPNSPRPRVGTTLSPLVLPDSNQNMAGAFLNDHRGTIYAGFQRNFSNGRQWTTTASYSPGFQEAFRGFLTQVEDVPDNARGVRENIQQTDVYVDTHVSWKILPSMEMMIGGDYLFGLGKAQGADFTYTAPLSGVPAPIVAPPDTLDFHIHDTRNFFGPYISAEWTPYERWRIDAGIRLNITQEFQTVIDGGAGTYDSQKQTNVHPGINVGTIFTAWQNNENNIGLFVNYRDTFKPAAIDFGIGEEAEGGGGDLILQPETSQSVEGGMKGRFLRGRMEVEASGFLMNFDNLVTPTSVNGIPALINAGKEQFKGFESAVMVALPKNLSARATYSYHNARFTDFVQDFDGVPTQLAGKRIEMSPENLAAVGIMYSPAKGIFGNVQAIYTGSRYLNKRNTALAAGFTTLEIGVGYRTPRWTFFVNGRNLTDCRNPVSESELGDAQYYLLPAMRVEAGLQLRF